MSANFPPADGHTPNVARRSSDHVSPLSDFCYSLRFQRTIDIDQVGFNPNSGKVMWVIEDFATPAKNCTVSFNLAQSLGVPFIALKSSRRDHEHAHPVSFAVYHKEKKVVYENASWGDLKRVLEAIAKHHRLNTPVPRDPSTLLVKFADS